RQMAPPAQAPEKQFNVTSSTRFRRSNNRLKMFMRSVFISAVLVRVACITFNAEWQVRRTNVITASALSRLATTKVNNASAVSLPPIAKATLMSPGARSAVNAPVSVFVREGATWKKLELPAGADGATVHPQVPPNTVPLFAIQVTNKMVLKQG